MHRSVFRQQEKKMLFLQGKGMKKREQEDSPPTQQFPY